MWNRHNDIYVWMLACVLMLSACSGDDVAENGASDAETAVSFSATVPTFSLRSVVSSTSYLQTQTLGFGVFAYYTGSTPWATAEATATPNFMYNQQVTYSTDHWTYSPVKYWPNDNQPADGSGATGSQAHSYVSFFAYAPYSGAGLTSLSGNTATEAPTVGYTWVNNVDPDSQGDLLYATPQTNLTKPDVSSVVTFEFYHALAAIEFKVRRKDATGAPIILSGLTLNSSAAATAATTALGTTITTATLNTSGTFNLGTSAWGSFGTSTPTITYADTNIHGDLKGTHSADATKTGVTEYTDETAHALTAYTPNLLLLMPQENTVTIPFTLSYTLGGTAKSPSSIITFTKPEGGWALAMGKKYTVVLIIDGGEVESYLLRAQEAEQW
ncbi:MAG: hypothetical protein IJV09_01835 [Prevotella sp.]|nr:hypothetical protein [Prevotella sp.]